MRDPHRADGGNGHRRRQLRARVLHEETHCALCGTRVDKTLKFPHPQSPVVDEDIPRSQGGSPYDRNNCHLMHKACNEFKGATTLTQARTKWQTKHHTVEQLNPSPIW